MHINYTAIDGYKLSGQSILAALMSDSAAGMITDRSGAGNGLTANGTITTSAIATGSSTLVASGFSAANYYSRSYDADLDPGTLGLSLKIWFKRNTVSAAEYLVERDSNPTAQRYLIYMESDGRISARVDDNTTVRTATTVSTYDDNLPHCAQMSFDGSTITLLVDDAEIATATGATLLTLTNTSAVLHVGRGVVGTSPLGGSLWGLEIDINNVWSLAYMRLVYSLEKVLYRQYELFSIVGEAIDFENEAQQITPYYVTGPDYQQLAHIIDAGYVQNIDRAAALKFLKSTNYITGRFSEAINGWRAPDLSFSLDLEGSAASPQDPRTVYKISSGEQLTPVGGVFFNFGFTVREK